jgi:hypothetical protein
MGNLTRHARMRPCTLRLQGCNGGGDTTVFAHAPSISKGISYKSPDWWGAFACSHCHDIVDGRIAHHHTDEEIVRAWLRGIHETQLFLFDNGFLRVI